jgi:hypothetical protein
MDNHHPFSFITLHTKMFHPTTDQWSGKRLPMDGVLVRCSFILARVFLKKFFDVAKVAVIHRKSEDCS